MGKAPKAPNPVTTANAQTASNVETAIANAQLANVNQVDASGNSLTYTSTMGSNGIPQYTATQKLGEAGQQLLNTSQNTQQNLASLAQEQSGRLSGLLNKPLDFSEQRKYLEGLTAGNLDRTWDRQSQQNETALVNRGLRPGSDAYRDQMRDFNMTRSDAYNSANAANYGSALQSQMALRNQPLNEILALAGGSQVQSPAFTNTPQTQMAGTDVAGITNQGYANQMNQWNANQGLLGGLFSAGANLFTMSDRRAKTDIERIGQTDAGTPIYKFRYKTGGPVQIGYMAQDLLETQPNAVVEGPDGFYRVNYGEVV